MKSWEEDENYEKFAKFCDENGIKIGFKINQLIKEYLIQEQVIQVKK